MGRALCKILGEDIVEGCDYDIMKLSLRALRYVRPYTLCIRDKIMILLRQFGVWLWDKPGVKR